MGVLFLAQWRLCGRTTPSFVASPFLLLFFVLIMGARDFDKDDSPIMKKTTRRSKQSSSIDASASDANEKQLYEERIRELKRENKAYQVEIAELRKQQGNDSSASNDGVEKLKKGYLLNLLEEQDNQEKPGVPFVQLNVIHLFVELSIAVKKSELVDVILPLFTEILEEGDASTPNHISMVN